MKKQEESALLLEGFAPIAKKESHFASKCNKTKKPPQPSQQRKAGGKRSSRQTAHQFELVESAEEKNSFSIIYRKSQQFYTQTRS